MIVTGYKHTGGRHARTAALRAVLAHAGVELSEAMVFGLTGGIGAGYSFCPSVIRHGNGSGISIVGRHRAYVTGAGWYSEALDRLGLTYRVTESAAPKKAQQNLVGELESGRPAIVWCGRPKLPFLPGTTVCDLWMHEFAVFAIDAAGVTGTDRPAVPVTVALDALAEARNAVCTHKNRTLTLDPAKPVPAAVLRKAVKESLAACAQEMVAGRMKTFSLPGLALWADRIANVKNAKEGWPKVFAGGLMFDALRDAFESIETPVTGGGLYRPFYADFLDEAGKKELAATYRTLGQQWTALADALLPDRVAAFKKTKAAIRKRDALFAAKGPKAVAAIDAETTKIAALAGDARKALPDDATTHEHLQSLSREIAELHRAETAAAEALARA